VCLQIYQFPDCDSDEDEEFKQQDRELKACVPFAVVGSNTVIEVAGKKVRGRQYPWGVVEGEFLSTLLVLCSKSESLIVAYLQNSLCLNSLLQKHIESIGVNYIHSRLRTSTK
jgi:septin family protein